MKSLLVIGLLAFTLPVAGGGYNPLITNEKPESKLTSFKYDGREVPLKIYLPPRKPAPVILLSHGLGGSREVGTYLGDHWASRGYVVVAMQHAGSDNTVWKNAPAKDRMKALQAAASAEAFLDRTKDVPATLDQLTAWNKEKGHLLEGRMDLSHVGMAGHSFGAVTTQALAGQAYGRAGAKYADTRIDAALALSPSVPRMGNAKRAFGKIELPMMLMTGTKDESVIGRATPETRREVYAALPPGSKYELVLKDAEHMAFSDANHQRTKKRNPNHHKVILALSTAFWDAYLKDGKDALGWLDSEKPEALLETGDLWQTR